VVAREPAGNTAVMTYPNVQQLTNNWNPTARNFTGSNDVPLSALSGLTSSYSETMPQASSGTIAQIAWDIWVANNSGASDEIMVWMDNQVRGTGGSQFNRTVTIAGQPWSLYFYGGTSAETIWMPGTQNQFQHVTASTVDLRALLNALVSAGFQPPGLTIGQIDFGWEICSTGGVSQTFRVSGYALTMSAA